jgi:hypothetical protein
MAPPEPPIGWNNNVAVTTRASGIGGEAVILVFTCYHLFFDLVVRVDVFYDTAQRKCFRIFGCCEGWAPIAIYPDAGSLFLSMPSRELVLPVAVPNQKYNKADPNDRNTTASFQWLYKKQPKATKAKRPITLRIMNPRCFSKERVDGIVEFLGLFPPIWRSEWRQDRSEGGKKLTLVAEPKSDFYWCETLELCVEWVHTQDYLNLDLYSLTATGFFAGAAYRFSVGRKFPFLIKVDSFRRKIEKDSLAHQALYPFLKKVVPSVTIDSVTFPTQEDPTQFHEMGNNPAWERLYHPLHVPDMDAVEY